MTLPTSQKLSTLRAIRDMLRSPSKPRPAERAMLVSKLEDLIADLESESAPANPAAMKGR